MLNDVIDIKKFWNHKLEKHIKMLLVLFLLRVFQSNASTAKFRSSSSKFLGSTSSPRVRPSRSRASIFWSCQAHPSPMMRTKRKILNKKPNRKDSRFQFHQHFMWSFYEPRSQKGKEDSQVDSLFAPMGYVRVKAEHKMLVKLTPVTLHSLKFLRNILMKNSKTLSRFCRWPKMRKKSARKQKKTRLTPLQQETLLLKGWWVDMITYMKTSDSDICYLLHVF